MLEYTDWSGGRAPAVGIVLVFVILGHTVAQDEPNDEGDGDPDDQSGDLVGGVAAVEEQRPAQRPQLEAKADQANDGLISPAPGSAPQGSGQMHFE
jgi:hypothetical protein